MIKPPNGGLKTVRWETMKEMPKHIAVIMDGNGRWAKQRKKMRAAGHRQGVEALREVLEKADELGIRHLTVYAFSTENWARPKAEIKALMLLLLEYIKGESKALHKKNVRITTIGDLTSFDDKIQKEIAKAKALTKENTGLNFNIALNYGARDEIKRAVSSIIDDERAGKREGLGVSEEEIEKHLDTRNLPDPDLLIRTSGEMRLSNYLLWQLAYTELVFTETLWPDFTGKDLEEAIKEYQNRDRRFGKI